MLAETAGVNQRRHPLAQRDRRRSGKYFFISPHRMGARAQRFERQRAFGDGQVVSREQWRLADRAEVLQRRVRDDLSAGVARTLEVRECRGHETKSLAGRHAPRHARLI